MEDNGNLRLQILEEFRNIKSLFLTEVKSFKNEFLLSCVNHSPSEKVHGILTSKISERFIKEEQISVLREQLRNKGKIINSLINHFSKNNEVIQIPIINPQDKNIFLKTAEENMTPVKQKLSHNTKTTNNADLNTSVIKASKVEFTIEKSNEIETDLSNNADRINKKLENKEEIRKTMTLKLKNQS